MTNPTWGREIAVDGVRPAWLEGFDPSAWKGDKFSPNLSAWLRLNARRNPGLNRMFRDSNGARWIGRLDDDGWFVGSRLGRVLTRGGRAMVGTWFPKPDDGLSPEDVFWTRYSAIGRCAIDEQHTSHFIGGENRWVGDEDRRSCVWCGAFHQTRERWTEKVERDRWVSAPALAAREAAK